jgi:hypothetical protein
LVHVRFAQLKLQDMLDDPIYRQRWINYAAWNKGALL